MDSHAFFDRYAVSTWLFSSRPLDAALREIADAGFTWIEIWADRYHLDPRLDPDVDAVGRLVADLGLRVHSVHTPFNGLNLGHPTLGDAAEWRRLVGESIRHTGALGAHLAVVHPSSYRDPLPEGTEGQSREIARAAIADLTEIAASAGTRIAVENMTDFGYWRYGTSIGELAAEFTDPRVGFCLDAGHAALNHIPLASEVAAAGDRLISIHAANNDGQRDLHSVPTEGVIDWPAFEATLAEASYRHHLVLEVNGRDDPDAQLARMKNLWREM
jgi:sugar phosphate isomerase/epimerase